jgi:hypothetical protein
VVSAAGGGSPAIDAGRPASHPSRGEHAPPSNTTRTCYRRAPAPQRGLGHCQTTLPCRHRCLGVERQAVDPRRRTAASMQENGQRTSRVTSRSCQSLRARPSRHRSDQVRANDDAGCAAVQRYGRGVGMERLGAGRPSPWRRPAPETSPAGADGHCGEGQHEVRGRHLGCVTLEKNDRRQPAVTARHRPGRLATTQVPAASAALTCMAWRGLPQLLAAAARWHDCSDAGNRSHSAAMAAWMVIRRHLGYLCARFLDPPWLVKGSEMTPNWRRSAGPCRGRRPTPRPRPR